MVRNYLMLQSTQNYLPKWLGHLIFTRNFEGFRDLTSFFVITWYFQILVTLYLISMVQFLVFYISFKVI